MGYIDSNLLPGETVVYRARLHTIIFMPAVGFALLGALVLVIALGSPQLHALVWVAALLLVVAVAIWLARYVKYRTSEFAITDKRVLVKVGLVRRHTLELLLSKVETVGVEQTVWGRLLNFGTIVVTGTGGTKEPFQAIAHPLEFRKQVQARAIV